METFQRKHRTGGITTHQIFTAEEAAERGIRYVPWREGTVGGWVMTDDGYVCQVLGRKQYVKDGKQFDFMQLSFMSIFVAGKRKVLWEQRRGQRAYGLGKTKRKWIDVEMGKTRLKRLVDAYIEQTLEIRGGKRADYDFQVLGEVYRKDQREPSWTAKMMLRQPEVKQVISEKLSKLAAEEGVTPAWVMQKLKAAVDLAENVQDVGSMIRGLKEFREMLDMTPEKGDDGETRAVGDYSRLLEDADFREVGAGAEVPGVPAAAGLPGDMLMPAAESKLPVD